MLEYVPATFSCLDDQDLAEDLLKIYWPQFGVETNVLIIQTIYSDFKHQFTTTEINA